MYPVCVLRTVALSNNPGLLLLAFGCLLVVLSPHRLSNVKAHEAYCTSGQAQTQSEKWSVIQRHQDLCASIGKEYGKLSAMCKPPPPSSLPFPGALSEPMCSCPTPFLLDLITETKVCAPICLCLHCLLRDVSILSQLHSCARLVHDINCLRAQATRPLCPENLVPSFHHPLASVAGTPI